MILCVNRPVSLDGQRCNLVTACPEPRVQSDVHGFWLSAGPMGVKEFQKSRLMSRNSLALLVVVESCWRSIPNGYVQKPKSMCCIALSHDGKMGPISNEIEYCVYHTNLILLSREPHDGETLWQACIVWHVTPQEAFGWLENHWDLAILGHLP
jgi:hypothetical protein